MSTLEETARAQAENNKEHLSLDGVVREVAGHSESGGSPAMGRGNGVNPGFFLRMNKESWGTVEREILFHPKEEC